jgi:hypothetical protein
MVKSIIHLPKYWYHTIGLIPPILASVFIGPILYNMLSSWGIMGKNVHSATKALIVGAIIGILIYFLLRILMTLSHDKHSNIVSKAVLGGLLAAEVLVHAPANGVSFPPSMAAITLWLFFWYHSVEQH